MSESFENLGVIGALAAGLHTIGIETPTPIQAQVIPLALAGKDIIGQSATGTGKTLAYLLPVMQKIDTDKRENQVLILAPTHELAIQIQRRIEELVKASGIPATAAPIIGNVNIERQIDKLKEKPHIITGSGGRILELIQKKKINAQTVRIIILDEADRLLDDQNLDSVKAVIKTTLRQRQIMLFSATIPAGTLARAKEFMADPAVVSITGQEKVPDSISHLYFLSEQRDKIELLRKLTRSMAIEKALVFINKGENIDTLAAKLNYHGITAVGLYGGAEKSDRRQAMEAFQSGKAQLLLASDLAARGLDISGVDYVLNLDLPEDPQVYLHRAGRTGRAGRKGTVISIAARHELALVKQIAKTLNIPIVPMEYTGGRIMEHRPRTPSERNGRTSAKNERIEKSNQHESNGNRKPGQKLR